MLDLVALVEGPVRAHYDLNSLEPADKRPKVEAETLPADKKTHARAPSSHVPYLSEAQRDRRTVFCQRLAPDCGSRDLERFFADEHGCAVRHARIVYDKRTRKSKGVAYVEFFEEEAVKRRAQERLKYREERRKQRELEEHLRDLAGQPSDEAERELRRGEAALASLAASRRARVWAGSSWKMSMLSTMRPTWVGDSVFASWNFHARS